MTPLQRNLRNILCAMLAFPLAAGCAQADLTTLQEQRAELSNINDQLERDIDGLDQRLVALDLERDELLTDTELTANTRQLTDSYINQLRRIRNVGRSSTGSTSSSSGSTATSSGGNTSTTSTTAPKKSLEITAYGVYAPGVGRVYESVEMQVGTISQSIDVDAPMAIRLQIDSDTPSTCAVQQVTRRTGYTNGFDATFTLVGTGDCSITASYPGSVTYEPATVTTTITVVKKALTITAYDIYPGGTSGSVDMERGTISQTFNLSAANPIELTVVSDTPSTCALQQVTRVDGYKNRFNATFTLVGTGDCSITASYPGDNTYEPASVTTTITVT